MEVAASTHFGSYKMLDVEKLSQCLRSLEAAHRSALQVLHYPPCPDDEARKVVWQNAICNTLSSQIAICREILKRTPQRIDAHLEVLQKDDRGAAEI
jgi:hypothetical protein